MPKMIKKRNQNQRRKIKRMTRKMIKLKKENRPNRNSKSLLRNSWRRSRISVIKRLMIIKRERKTMSKSSNRNKGMPISLIDVPAKGR